MRTALLFLSTGRGRARGSAAAGLIVWVMVGCTASLPLPTEATPSATPTPFVATSWELREVQLAPPHAQPVVMGVSPDGSLIVFRDSGVYDLAYLLLGGTAVEPLVPPDHEPGVPVWVEMFHDGLRLVVQEQGSGWIYDSRDGSFAPLPEPPSAMSVEFVEWVPLPDGRLAALTGTRASWEFGGVTDTQVWLFEPSTADFERLGSRRDAIFIRPVVDGVAVLVDMSASHDNSAWILVRLGSDGSDRDMYHFNGGVQSLEVAPGGRHVAFARGGEGVGGNWLVDLTTGAETRLSDGVVDPERGIRFSPDGTQVAFVYADGHTEAFDLSGSRTISIASPSVGWFGLP